MRNAKNVRTFCLEDYHYAFRETLYCDTRLLDLCISFKILFLYLWYIPPHSCAFPTFCFAPIFLICTLLCEIFFLFIPDDTVRSATARNLIFIFNFSSQRPQLNYTLLLTFIVLIQRNFPYNISANLFQFTNEASSHVAIV